MNQDRIDGLFVGLAVGDSIGLATEGLRPSRIRSRGWGEAIKHRFLPGRGMWSDDTEHAIMLAQSLLKSSGNERDFIRSFAWELRWWILGMPAGCGMATAKAVIKLWLGWPADRSGVFSAGNGPVMRTPVVAAMFPYDPELRLNFVRLHTKMTHSDPRAEISAIVITELCALMLEAKTKPGLAQIIELMELANQKCANGMDDEWSFITGAFKHSFEQSLDLTKFFIALNVDPEKGVSGYAYHTVPAVLYAGLRNSWDYESTLTELIRAGGDTDTVAAIAGAVCGAYGGLASIPSSWQKGVSEWPVSISDLLKLSRAIPCKHPTRIRAYWSPFLILRNLFFLSICLIHGFLRLFLR